MEGAPDAALVEALAGRIAAARTPGRLFVAGIGGPQGSGKSTLATALADRLRDDGLKVAVLSLDDLYLGREARAELARDIHPLFAVRGPPGTHDVALGLDTLESLARPGETALPRFDKATDDRTAPQPFAGPADVALFEGWCLGARSDPASPRAPPLNAMEREADLDGAWRGAVEAALADGYSDLWSRIDFLAWLQPPDFDTVVAWRGQQEHALRDRLTREAAPGRAMTDAEVARFVQHYERITRRLMVEAPAAAHLVVELDGDRRVVSVNGGGRSLAGSDGQLRQARASAEACGRGEVGGENTAK